MSHAFTPFDRARAMEVLELVEGTRFHHLAPLYFHEKVVGLRGRIEEVLEAVGPERAVEESALTLHNETLVESQINPVIGGLITAGYLKVDHALALKRLLTFVFIEGHHLSGGIQPYFGDEPSVKDAFMQHLAGAEL